MIFPSCHPFMPWGGCQAGPLGASPPRPGNSQNVRRMVKPHRGPGPSGCGPARTTLSSGSLSLWPNHASSTWPRSGPAWSGLRLRRQAGARDRSSAIPTSSRSTPSNGRWQHRGELWTDWCGGFHAGMMWLIAQRTGDPWWRQHGRALLAAARTQAARPRRPRPRLHLPQHVSALVSR